jgi:hypothetical protein
VIYEKTNKLRKWAGQMAKGAELDGVIREKLGRLGYAV